LFEKTQEFFVSSDFSNKNKKKNKK